MSEPSTDTNNSHDVRHVSGSSMRKLGLLTGHVDRINEASKLMTCQFLVLRKTIQDFNHFARCHAAAPSDAIRHRKRTHLYAKRFICTYKDMFCT